MVWGYKERVVNISKSKRSEGNTICRVCYCKKCKKFVRSADMVQTTAFDYCKACHLKINVRKFKESETIKAANVQRQRMVKLLEKDPVSMSLSMLKAMAENKATPKMLLDIKEVEKQKALRSGDYERNDKNLFK